MTEIERRVIAVLLSGAREIPTSQVRGWLKTGKRVVLTKNNFPNIRHLLESHMTAYRHGMYRGGMSWVCVIAPKNEKHFEREVAKLGL